MANRRPANRPLTSTALRATAISHRDSGRPVLAIAATECEAIADRLDAESDRLDSQVAWCTDREQSIIRAAKGVEIGERDWGLNLAV